MTIERGRAPANRAEVVVVMAVALAGSPFASVEIVASWMNDAETVLAALEAAGVRLVPAEATRRIKQDGADAEDVEMLDPWVRIEGIYNAAIAASPYAPEGGR